MSESTKQEIQALRQIKKDKEMAKQEVFFEDIYTFPIEMNAKKERENRKRRNFDIGKQLQEDREQEKWDKFENRLALSRDNGQNQRPKTGQEVSPDAEKGGMLGGGQFGYMNIDELKQHESGILNLFEGEKNIAKYISHNQLSA